MLRCYIDLALLMQSKARVPRGGSFNSIRLDYSVHLVVAELDFESSTEISCVTKI